MAVHKNALSSFLTGALLVSAFSLAHQPAWAQATPPADKPVQDGSLENRKRVLGEKMEKAFGVDFRKSLEEFMDQAEVLEVAYSRKDFKAIQLASMDVMELIFNETLGNYGPGTKGEKKVLAEMLKRMPEVLTEPTAVLKAAHAKRYSLALQETRKRYWSAICEKLDIPGPSSEFEQSPATVSEIDRWIEEEFWNDPQVLAVQKKIDELEVEVKRVEPLARSSQDPAVRLLKKRLLEARKDHKQLWETRYDGIRFAIETKRAATVDRNPVSNEVRQGSDPGAGSDHDRRARTIELKLLELLDEVKALRGRTDSN